MGKSVIIVESPAKTKTIKSFLGQQYEVAASLGHVRDLPRTMLGVDVENRFAPTYHIPPEKKKVLAQLEKVVARADEVFLASDPDREGEAIAWHLAEVLKLPKPQRIEFNEITAQAVQEALAHPRPIDMDRVEAQQARRVLDRLVGYKLSPLLWRKIKKNLSAGRVQSPALRLICEREREIQAFVAEEYWTLTARLSPQEKKDPFLARLERKDGRKLQISNGEEAQAIVEELQQCSYVVQCVKQDDRKKHPPPPFITSTLQRAASQKLRFPAQKTMKVAQELYEGISIGSQGTVGLITYMRTDSTRVADSARQEARQYIASRFGRNFLPTQPRQARSPKGAQEAHEAVRPTSVQRTPEDLKPYLSRDQYRLYQLIWERFVASQMAPALLHVVQADIQAGLYTFRAQGTTVKFPGFLALTGEPEPKEEDSGEEDGDTAKRLPPLAVGQVLDLLELLPKQNFTQPPPRYTEATLIKTLEERGLGRPSTYAQILSTLQERKYVTLEERRFRPTALGFAVNDQLVEHFPQVMDLDFTAHLETQLDLVERGKVDWVELLQDFYGPFSEAVAKAEKAMQRIHLQPTVTDQPCPNCGAPLVRRDGPYGEFLACQSYPRCQTRIPLDKQGQPKKMARPSGLTCERCGSEMLIRVNRRGEEFLGCSGYPQCRHTLPIETLSASLRREGQPAAKPAEGPSEEPPTPTCDQCGRPMVRKSSRWGDFWGCSGYPHCRNTRSITVELEVPCPREGCPGKLVQKRGKKGRFFGCNQYPQCTFTTWLQPLSQTCPQCGSALGRDPRKTDDAAALCLREGCGYSGPLEGHPA
jgi:DNA topoisomerase-1